MATPDYTQTAKLMQQTGLPANVPWATQLTQDEIEWGAITTGGAGGANDPYAQNWTKGGGFTGFKFDGTLATADVMRVLGFAEQFASTYGWKYYPPAVVIQALAHQSNLSAQSAYEQFFQQLPQAIQQANPWMEFGMTQADYGTALGTMNDTISEWTGLRNLDPAIAKKALQQNWSPEQFEEFVKRNPAVIAQAPWIQYGYNYDQWQQYKLDPNNELNILHRFGWNSANLNDQNFLLNLSQPLEKISAGGSQVTPAPTGITPQKTVSARGTQSAVR
jgi:hypothetical protein